MRISVGPIQILAIFSQKIENLNFWEKLWVNSPRRTLNLNDRDWNNGWNDKL